MMLVQGLPDYQAQDLAAEVVAIASCPLLAQAKTIKGFHRSWH